MLTSRNDSLSPSWPHRAQAARGSRAEDRVQIRRRKQFVDTIHLCGSSGGVDVQCSMIVCGFQSLNLKIIKLALR